VLALYSFAKFALDNWWEGGDLQVSAAAKQSLESTVAAMKPKEDS
jgi:hypothetical protein